MTALRPLFEGLKNAVCRRDWVVLEDAWGDINACRRGGAFADGDTVLRWDLRKGQAQRIARRLRWRKENTPQPICPPEDVQ